MRDESVGWISAFFARNPPTNCQNGGYPEPIWEELRTVIRVTFFPHPEVVKEPLRTKLGLSRNQVSIGFRDNNFIRCRIPKNITKLMDVLAWKSRTKFRQKYIAPLIEKGLLKMTILDKPQSSKQKYQLTEEGLKQLTSHVRGEI